MQGRLKYGRCWRAQFFPRLESENVSSLREWCPGFWGWRPSAPKFGRKTWPKHIGSCDRTGFKKKTRIMITSRSVSRHQGHYIMEFGSSLNFSSVFVRYSVPHCAAGGTQRKDAVLLETTPSPGDMRSNICSHLRL